MLKYIHDHLFGDFIKIFLAGGDEVPSHVDGAGAHHEAVFPLAKELAGAVLDAWKNGDHPFIVFVFAEQINVAGW